MILFISYDDDPAAAAAERLLRERGIEVIRFEALRFPSANTALTLRMSARGKTDRRLVIDGSPFDLNAVRAVWHRRHRVEGSPELRDPKMRAFAAIESEQFLWQLWAGLGVPFVPGPLGVVRAAQHKLRQLEVAAALGFEIPPSIVTSEPEELVDFFRRNDGRVITKLLVSTSMDQAGLNSEYIRFTETLSWRDLADRNAMRWCPVYAQANVPKALELRVTVVGERVFPVEIHSQAALHGRQDWRKAGPAAVTYRRHDLPDELSMRCVELTRALGLTYGAMDLILRPDGQYVFLEINPAGEYYWVEQRTGLPITRAIVDLLASHAEG